MLSMDAQVHGRPDMVRARAINSIVPHQSDLGEFLVTRGCAAALFLLPVIDTIEGYFMRLTVLAASAALLFAGPALAQVVDGQNTGGTEYSGGVTVVTNPAAPNGNFGSPTNQATAGYTIQLNDADGSLFGLITQTGGEAVGAFANLYFDLDRATRSGSDVGFEVGANGVRAFVPENGSNAILDASLYSFASTTNNGLLTVEFRLADSLFNGPIAGLNYNPALTFTGDNRLQLSQSLGYSVAGGATSYGATRLGTFSSLSAVAAVPEPSTWAMMLLGFGAIGGTMRRTRRSGRHIAQVA
jgi:hypothetical protein